MVNFKQHGHIGTRKFPPLEITETYTIPNYQSGDWYQQVSMYKEWYKIKQVQIVGSTTYKWSDYWNTYTQAQFYVQDNPWGTSWLKNYGLYAQLWANTSVSTTYQWTIASIQWGANYNIYDVRSITNWYWTNTIDLTFTEDWYTLTYNWTTVTWTHSSDVKAIIHSIFTSSTVYAVNRVIRQAIGSVYTVTYIQI